MHEALQRNLFLVKEHIGAFKAANNFDIHDPESGQVILECREPNLGTLTRLLRFTDYKRYTPFDLRVTAADGTPVVRVTRGPVFLRSRVRVFDGDDEEIGGFYQRLLSIGGKFDVLDADDNLLCSLQGKWTGWEFSFRAGDAEFARVTKKWAGVGRELFTSADSYVLQISDVVPPDNRVRELILAAVLCIDMVLKE